MARTICLPAALPRGRPYLVEVYPFLLSINDNS